MTELQTVRKSLERRRSELMEKVSEIDSTLRQPDSADSEERAVETEDDEVLESLGNAALGEISQIEAAFESMDKGTYGVCTACHEPIDEKRLNALPYTAICQICAKEFELESHKHK